MKIIESTGDTDYNGLVVVDQIESAMQLLEQCETEFAEYIDELNRRNDEIAGLKERLYEVMTEKQIKKLEGERLTFSLVSPSTTKGLDLKLLEATQPQLFAELHNQYGKDTNRKGYVRLTTKKDDTRKYIK